MQRSFFNSSHGRISFLRREGKTPVIFIHGFTASAYIWRSLTRYLDSQLDLTYIDLFGHGKSEMPSLEGVELSPRSMIHLFASSINELIESLGVEKYSVVGSSMGGWIALELASKFRKPEKGVLIDSAGLMTITDGKFAAGFLELLREYRKRKGKAGRLLMEMVQNSDPAELTMEKGIIEAIDFSTCIIWGSADHILDPEYGERISQALHDSEFHLIDGADHVPFRTHPREVAEILNSFLLW